MSELKINECGAYEREVEQNWAAAYAKRLAGELADGTALEDNCIYSRHIREGNVTTEKIQDLNVTGAKLAGGAVSEDKIVSGAVSEDKLAGGAVTEAKLSNAFKLPLHKLVTVLSGSPSNPIDLNMLEDGIYAFHSYDDGCFENLPFFGGTFLVQITDGLKNTTSGFTIAQFAFHDSEKGYRFRHGSYDGGTQAFVWTEWA